MSLARLSHRHVELTARGELKNNFNLGRTLAAPKIDTTLDVVDATGRTLVVGDKYEMYAPIAKASQATIGLTFEDDVGFSFTYAGVVLMGGDPYIASPDVGYDDEGTVKLSPELTQLLYGKGTPHPVCPVYIVAKFIRPVTDE